MLFGGWRKHCDRCLVVLRSLDLMAAHEVLHHRPLLLLFRRRSLRVGTGCVVGTHGRSSILGGGTVLSRVQHLILVREFLEQVLLVVLVLILIVRHELIRGPLGAETGREKILVRGDVS